MSDNRHLRRADGDPAKVSNSAVRRKDGRTTHSFRDREAQLKSTKRDLELIIGLELACHIPLEEAAMNRVCANRCRAHELVGVAEAQDIRPAGGQAPAAEWPSD